MGNVCTYPEIITNQEMGIQITAFPCFEAPFFLLKALCEANTMTLPFPKGAVKKREKGTCNMLPIGRVVVEEVET